MWSTFNEWTVLMYLVNKLQIQKKNISSFELWFSSSQFYGGQFYFTLLFFEFPVDVR